MNQPISSGTSVLWLSVRQRAYMQAQPLPGFSAHTRRFLLILAYEFHRNGPICTGKMQDTAQTRILGSVADLLQIRIFRSLFLSKITSWRQVAPIFRLSINWSDTWVTDCSMNMAVHDQQTDNELSWPFWTPTCSHCSVMHTIGEVRTFITLRHRLWVSDDYRSQAMSEQVPNNEKPAWLNGCFREIRVRFFPFGGESRFFFRFFFPFATLPPYLQRLISHSVISVINNAFYSFDTLTIHEATTYALCGHFCETDWNPCISRFKLICAPSLTKNTPCCRSLKIFRSTNTPSNAR